MKRLNLIIVLDPTAQQVLMCKRAKDPYQGLYNFVGGKVESDDALSEAYRELSEETGITEQDIVLAPLMTLIYPPFAEEIAVYYGRLQQVITLVEEANPLLWMPINEDFFDHSRFAGEGNIGHMMACIRLLL